MEYVGTAHAAEILGVTMATVSRWCREGKIAGAEQDAPGKPWRISVAEIERLLEPRTKRRN